MLGNDHMTEVKLDDHVYSEAVRCLLSEAYREHGNTGRMVTVYAQ